MAEIGRLLTGSDTPQADLATFMRANVIFRLIGATDGHARNASIVLDAGGRFRLAPLHDVLTAQPSLDSGRIARNKFKLAMSVGTNRHYAIENIVPRHFVEAAHIAGIGVSAIGAVRKFIASGAVWQANGVVASLPDGFPEQIATSLTAAIGHRTQLIADHLRQPLHA